MTVPVAIPITSATANGVTTVFPYQFKLARDTDLVVTVNGLVRTLNTDYTASGVGNDAGGNVTFNIPPANLGKVVLRRVMAFKRDTNYVNLGDLLASTLNADQDDPIMMIQQLAANSLVMVEQSNGEFVWDAKGFRLINLGDAVDPTDAVNQRTALSLIEQSLTGTGTVGGTLSVTPKFWEFTGDGVSTDFDLDGADVDNLLFYDVALAGSLQEPYDQYSIVGNPTDGFAVRFVAAPTNGIAGWAVLRGYARPYSGEQPLTTVASTVTTVTGDTTIDGTFQNKIILVNSATDVTLTIPANTGGQNDWKTGEFFSVMQFGAGKVTLVAGGAGVLYPSPGFEAETRDQNSIISATCIYADADHWGISGDLLPTATSPEVHAFTLPCSDEATTNIAVATDLYRFHMPYALLLTGVRVTLNVAQASGTVLTVDIKQNGVSIFSTKLTIDNAETSSKTSSAPYVLVAAPNDTILADDALISVDVTQIGTAGARGLKAQLIGERAS